MNIKDEGIVLKELRFKETSKILTILTRNHGKIHGIARGAYRPKSKLIINTQPFSYNNYIFYKGRNFYYITQADIIDSFYSIREDINRMLYGSYLLELANTSILEGQGSNQLFYLLRKGIDILSKLDNDYLKFILAYELKFISILGYKPLLDRCVMCGRKDSKKYRFSIEYGGIICDSCYSVEQNSEYMDLPMYNALRQLLYTPLNRINYVKISKSTMFKLHQIMVKYILHNIDRNKFNSLDILKSIDKNGGDLYGNHIGYDR